MIRAVLFDFGGVILTSPFEAFNRYEAEVGLPLDTIRRINATDPDSNAWARFERSELTPSEFVPVFEDEARALGFDVDATRVLDGLKGEIRPEMVEALRRITADFKTAMLTNNFRSVEGDSGVEAMTDARAEQLAEIHAMFDEIIESSVVGVRKPEREFYEIACARLSVLPEECVFLDDLGVNLKPARAMGMTTIKVLSADQALTDLEAVLGVALR